MRRSRWMPILAPALVVGAIILGYRLFRPVSVHKLPRDWQHPDVAEDPQAAFMEPPELLGGVRSLPSDASWANRIGPNGPLRNFSSGIGSAGRLGH